MENYYYHNGQDRCGPYAMHELKARFISRDTLVWKEGMKDWVKASDLDELRELFGPSPVAGIGPTQAEHEKRTRNLILAVFFFIVLICGFFWISPKTQFGSTYLPPVSMVDQERVNPVAYLVTTGTYKPNFWFTKWHIDGFVSNVAGHTNYKDVVVKINFYSRTNTVIATKEYVLYDYFPYGLKKGFTLEVDRPTAATTCGWEAMGAKVY